MDTSPRVDELLARAVDEQVAEQRSWRAAVEALTERVAAVELAIAALRDELGGAVESGARAAVAGELDGVSTELRRQISDLGRMIVNDLGKLPRIIRETRGDTGGATGGGRSGIARPEMHLDLDLDLPYADAAGDEQQQRRGRFRRH